MPLGRSDDLVILLGAGASAEAGIPTARNLTDRFLDESSANERISKVLRFVVGSLVFHAGARGDDPRPLPDIEQVVTILQSLASRSLDALAPFVGQWHPFLRELEAPRFTEAELENLRSVLESVTKEALRRVESEKSRTPSIFSSRKTFDWEASRLGQVVEKLGARTGEATFREAEQWVIGALKRIVWLMDASRVAYLLPLVEVMRDLPGAHVATLNYDNTVELAAEQLGVRVSTGLDDWMRGFGFDVPSNACDLLLKLHGSIDWQFLEEHPLFNTYPTDFRVTRVKAENVRPTNYTPAIVFGGPTKLRAEGPFLELLEGFRTRLASAPFVWIIGYSFRDPHINEALFRWAHRDHVRGLVVVDQERISSTRPIYRRLEKMLGSKLEPLEMKASDGFIELRSRVHVAIT